MAHVQDSFGTTITRQVFLKPPDAVRQFTSMPRALVNYQITDGVVSAKPLNDTAETQVSIVLDFRFAYRLVDLTQHIIQDEANSWMPVAYLEITNAMRGMPAAVTSRHAWSLADSLTSAAGEMSVARPLNAEAGPRYVLQSVLQGIAPTITFKSFNITATAALAGTLSFMASFMEFDLEQVEGFPVHWPIPVFVR